MQVFLERRRRYIDANAGMKPANIIPVVWQPVPYRIPKTLPDIEYKNPNIDSDTRGVWNLGDEGRSRELIDIADQIALRIRNADDLTPLPAPVQRPRMTAVQSAFIPVLPLSPFDLPDTKAGPDAVTFVYPSAMSWNAWPWSPPENQAMLYLAAAVAKGREMEPSELAFDPADAGLTARLEALRQLNNTVVLFVDAANLDIRDLDARIQEYDRPEHASFAAVVLCSGSCPPALRARIERLFTNFARRAQPHFCIFETPGPFNAQMRERFSKTLAEALEQLRIVVVNNPNAPNVATTPSGFRTLPTVGG
jgi:hypothetical protein